MCNDIHTARQIDREVSFAITMTFIIENVTLNFIKSNEKSLKKICRALFEKIDVFGLFAKNQNSIRYNLKMVIFEKLSLFSETR